MKTVVATTSFYLLDSESSRVRSELALELMKQTKCKGYELVVADNGSSPEFLNKLKANDVEYVLQTKPGFGNGKRLAIEEASKKGDLIFLVEPEKVSLIDFIEQLTAPLISKEAEIVIPKRKSMASYPFFQQKSEELLNIFWMNVTKTDFDISFGPRIFNKEISNYFLNYNSQNGDRWESIFLPIIDAIKDDRKIKSVEVEYLHPKVQKENEEGNIEFDLKRLDQLYTISRAIHFYWKIKQLDQI